MVSRPRPERSDARPRRSDPSGGYWQRRSDTAGTRSVGPPVERKIAATAVAAAVGVAAAAAAARSAASARPGHSACHQALPPHLSPRPSCPARRGGANCQPGPDAGGRGPGRPAERLGSRQGAGSGRVETTSWAAKQILLDRMLKETRRKGGGSKRRGAPAGADQGRTWGTRTSLQAEATGFRRINIPMIPGWGSVGCGREGRRAGSAEKGVRKKKEGVQELGADNG